MKRLWLLLILGTAPCFAQRGAQSPAFELLGGLEGEDPANAPSAEAAKDQSAIGFSVQTLSPVGFVPLDESRPGESQPDDKQPSTPVLRPPLVFKAATPMKGLTIYTIEKTGVAPGPAEKPAAKGPIKKKIVYGALGLGAAAAVGGIFFAPLLLLGGMLLGAGAVLWLINRKFSK